MSISCFQFKGPITGLIPDSVRPILIDLIDLLDNLHRSCSALSNLLRDNQATTDYNTCLQTDTYLK